MCGINGIYGLERIGDPKKTMVQMNRSIEHRGPDATGIYQLNNIIFGHQRLKIIDLSDAANQPFTSSNGEYVLVFNGEIYNFKSIRKELENECIFKTESDTEVVLAAFQKWGVNCFKKFNGMFALAIWDVRNDRLFLARDRMGIKPLYYSYTNNRFVFSSELRAIKSTDLISKDLDSSSLADYLQYQTVHGENTILNEVKMMPPASWIKIEDNQLEIGEYWNISDSSTYDNRGEALSKLSLDETQLRIRETFTASVKDRMVADVPFGAFLSGGIDSSLVVANMTKIASERVKTFHVSFSEKEFSEAKYAQIIANKYKTDHTNIELSPNDLLKSLPEALSSMDHPSGDGPNSWLVSKVTKEAGISMVHSGLGGDELFAGYPVFKQLAELDGNKQLLSFPKFIRRLAGASISAVKPGVASDKKAEILGLDYFDLEHAYPVSRKLITNKNLKRYFDLIQTNNPVKSFIKNNLTHGNPGFGLPFLSKISVAEMRTYMHSVLLRDTDQMSMAHALEVRVPFLDHRLVELLMLTADKFKLGSTPKQLLIDSFNGELPYGIVNRPKMGFVFPWEKWMKKDLKDFCWDNLNFLESQKIFKKGSVIGYAEQFYKSNPSITWSRVWPLVVLGFWIKENLD